MDEHKPQEQASEKVPARRKSGRMRGWRASILACVICILVTALVTSMIFVGKFGGSSNYKLALKFAQVKQVVDKDYIGDADDTAISDASSSAIMSAIGDKWSYYMTAEEYKAYQMYSNNEYAGIGVTIQLDDKTKGFRITAVTSDSPAAKAGLQQGDIITAIDGEDVTGKTLSDVQSTIRATLKLTIQDSAGKSQTVTLDCTVIYTDPVTYKLMDNGVGYVQIRNFETGGGSRAVQAVDKLLDLGAKSLVFDLRDNGGGVLDDAISCIDLIAPEGTVAYAEDKNGNRTIIGSSDDESKVELPIVCLVNGNTASAAELFAASLRTMNGARLVGTTTMGKGTIQSSPQRLSDGSAVSITVAKLICGDGSCFDGTGLSVDVERALSAEETTNFYDYTPEDDPQIQRAVSAAQQLSGTTTLGGVNEAASSAAASEEADSAATEPENASSEETASSTEAEAGGEAASSAE